MQINFRTLVLASAAMAAAAMTSIPAMASSQVMLNVPFSFTVQGNSLPAGEYFVRRDDLGSHVKLESADAKHGYMWFIHATDAKADLVSLRFEVDGQNHTLQSIRYGNRETSKLTRKAKKGEDITPLTVVGQ
jgi:hypothetical protein